MDAGDLLRRDGLAGGLAWPAAGAMGRTELLARCFGFCAIVDSGDRIDQGRLPQHDLGGSATDAVFHHWCDGNVGQSAATTGCVGSNTTDSLLPVCFPQKEPGLRLISILCFLFLLTVLLYRFNFLQRLGPRREILPVNYVDAGHGMHEATGN